MGAFLRQPTLRWAASQFNMALDLCYPNAADRAHARSLDARSGGEVDIDGLGKQYAWMGARHRFVDSTDGCIAVTNEGIQEISGMVPVGTRVEIRP